jgi:predicted nucleotidyltransferase
VATNPNLGSSLQLRPLLELLNRHAVDFIVIGGIAGIVHGSAHPTFDFDVVYARDEQNLERMATALAELGVTLRGAPADLPFQIDTRILAAGCNFTFVSEYGSFDILGDAAGMRKYEAMLADSKMETVWGVPVRVVSIDDLIRMKRAAGRPKDKSMAEELIAIAEAQRRAAKGEKGASS